MFRRLSEALLPAWIRCVLNCWQRLSRKNKQGACPPGPEHVYTTAGNEEDLRSDYTFQMDLSASHWSSASSILG